MKNLFGTILFVLVISSLITWKLLEAGKTERPVLTWQTGICPDRYRQVALFREWMIANGHVDAAGEPLFEVRPEAAGNQSTMIQAVSGMGGDLIDFVPVENFAPMGVLEDLTGFARENRMDPEHNYPGSADLLCAGGRQYAYPRNLAVFSLYQNLDTFARYGVEPPPEEWTPEEFERIGVEFMRKANAGLERRRVFFCAYTFLVLQIARSRGADLFNETLTEVKLLRPEFVEALKLQKRWIDELHLMPDAAERASENTRSVIGDPGLAQFVDGTYAMMLCGRYIHMSLRDTGKKIRTANSLPPQYSFKNAKLYSSNTALYRGSRYKKEAMIFLKFLASRSYNDLLVATSDGLPPNPAMLENNPAYLAAPDHPWEGRTHANELKWARTIAYPEPVSPYYKRNTNPLLGAWERYSNELATAEEALRIEQERANRDIQAYAATYCPEEYRNACELQREIEHRLSKERRIPAAWITNTFLRAWLRANDRLEEDAEVPRPH